MKLHCVQEVQWDQTYGLVNVVEAVLRYVCVCVSVWKLRYWCPRKAENRPLLFLLQHIYPPMFVRADEGQHVSAGKTTAVFRLLRSLHLQTDNGITHQRSCSLFPILPWPLPAFVHIHHNNSPDPDSYRQAYPCFPPLSGERLNLDQNEKFICTEQLMAILIW